MLREYVETDRGTIDARKALKEYICKSIMMALQFHDLGLANLGTEIFALMWSMDDLAGIRYENPLWRTMMGRPRPDS